MDASLRIATVPGAMWAQPASSGGTAVGDAPPLHNPTEAFRPIQDPSIGLYSPAAFAPFRPMLPPMGAPPPFNYLNNNGFMGMGFPGAGIAATIFTTHSANITRSGVMRHETATYGPMPMMEGAGFGGPMGSIRQRVDTDYRLPDGTTLRSEANFGHVGLTAHDPKGNTLAAERTTSSDGREQLQVTNADGTLTILEPDTLALEIRTPRSSYSYPTGNNVHERVEALSQRDRISPDGNTHIIFDERSHAYEKHVPSDTRAGEFRAISSLVSHTYTDIDVPVDGKATVRSFSDEGRVRLTDEGEVVQKRKPLFGHSGPIINLVPSSQNQVGDREVLFDNENHRTVAVTPRITPERMASGQSEGLKALARIVEARYDKGFTVAQADGSVVVGGNGSEPWKVIQPDGSDRPLYVGSYQFEAAPTMDDHGRLVGVSEGRTVAINTRTGVQENIAPRS